MISLCRGSLFLQASEQNLSLKGKKVQYFTCIEKFGFLFKNEVEILNTVLDFKSYEHFQGIIFKIFYNNLRALKISSYRNSKYIWKYMSSCIHNKRKKYPVIMCAKI